MPRDEWFKTIPEVGVFMGDLNDTVWPSTRGMKRWWHHALQDGELIDPVYALHPQSHVPNVFGVRQPPITPAYVLHYSSFTPPSSGLNVYIVSHKKSSFQVSRNLESLGNFRGLGAVFFVFCVDR